LESGAVRQAAQDLLASGELILLEHDRPEQDISPQELITSRNHWMRLSSQVDHEVEAYHQAYPLRRGILREELKSRVKMPARLFNACVRKWILEGVLEENGLYIFIPVHKIQFSQQQQRLVDGLLGKFKANPFAPPSVKECKAEVGEEVYAALVETGELVEVSQEVVFRHLDFDWMVDEIRKKMQRQGTITAAEVRDYFNTSRKYVLAFLEYLDSQGVTVREGDARRLKK
jgi:selenocysteine-specific elongation factor